ncbi:riboflavin synthase [Neptunitalea lumnitzerae]|uniref:Riboflavin synthase n=1 Tax=Neptunitalea lumnitzerae TaxID=2965509 RepID=A0ABQ5MF56_9FLAO|nr:riboflavin synthase [Neptunitalea sp. Y10]GLB48032.1 riboflavin synthase subunit alpha [Neptunitalea sp. Y10]
MFTGIVEELGKVISLEKEQDNLHITVAAQMTKELKIDQSVSHNGVCLTVVNIDKDNYTVTAIKETLDKTNLGTLEVGEHINLERAMILGARLDGHIVQGHVDQTGTCTAIESQNGSTLFTFEYADTYKNITIEKGSITVNGTSLTVINASKTQFSVAIIPYTYEHTCFKNFKVGSKVNLEFDVVGKYIAQLNAYKYV